MAASSLRWSSHVLLLAWFIVLPSVVSASALERLFAPKSEPWDRWVQHEVSDRRQISHDTWDRFLDTYVMRSGDGVMRVAYGLVSDQDRALLDEYISRLGATPISSYSRAEQFAYWVNLYNALTVRVVLDHYPVMSIRDIDISPGLFADGPWRKALVAVEGEQLRLDDIEHRILRPIWGDPRIHYAVNCAAVGCPNLQSVAFTAENTERLLEAAARDYVNHPRGVRIDQGRITVSSIYNWFMSDFDRNGGVIEHIKRYAEPGLLAEIEGIERIHDYEYDWSLNTSSKQDG